MLDIKEGFANNNNNNKKNINNNNFLFIKKKHCHYQWRWSSDGIEVVDIINYIILALMSITRRLDIVIT